MAKAVALARSALERDRALELLRGVIVSVCALALAAAGPAFPLG
jgi:hypothetical protein